MQKVYLFLPWAPRLRKLGGEKTIKLFSSIGANELFQSRHIKRKFQIYLF